MSKGNNELLTFLLGTAVGVGAGLYLNSKNGKKMRKEAVHKISDMEQTIEDKVNKAYESLKDQVNN
ncbi:MAG: YtxH domain-containing protein, partial [Cryomorphaceae bacterium]